MFDKKYISAAIISLACLSATTNQVISHPHVFAQANLEVLTSDDGRLEELRHVWRFDEVFSSSIVLDFDDNNNLILDESELVEIGNVVNRSLVNYDHYTLATLDGQDIKMAPPDTITANYVDNQLLLIFAMKPVAPVKLDGKFAIGVYDPTFYTAVEFASNRDMSLSGPYAEKCKSDIIRPDVDEVIAQNQDNLTDAFYDDSEGNDLSKLFATRIEFKCN